MPRDLKFFYFGWQCPHNAYLLARIKTIAWQERVKLHLFDVTGDEETCREYRIFSPTMVIVNDKYRWHGPFTRERILMMLEDEEVRPESPPITQSEEVARGELVPITPRSVLDTCAPCMNMKDKAMCYGKAEWMTDMLKGTELKHFGYLHYVDGECVGGAEFLPSTRVPYPIPDKRADNAYLTCTYVSSSERDFKSHPLERLIQDLRGMRFTTLSVAAAEESVFPNGPMDWFLRKGFADKGVLVREDLHGVTIHHLQLNIASH